MKEKLPFRMSVSFDFVTTLSKLKTVKVISDEPSEHVKIEATDIESVICFFLLNVIPRNSVLFENVEIMDEININ